MELFIVVFFISIVFGTVALAMVIVLVALYEERSEKPVEKYDLKEWIDDRNEVIF